MTEQNNLNDPIFTAYAFFAGASFTSLFFVLQAKSSFVFADFVITLVAIGSVLLFMATFGRLNIATGRIAKNTTFSFIVGLFALFGVGFLFLSIILVVFTFSIIGGITVSCVTIGSFFILDIMIRREK